jgi:Tfp pilus assembly protein PilZ
VKFGKDKPDKVGFTEDVSSGGLFIKTNAVLQPGSLLQIELTLPDHRVLLMAGQVMWARQVPPSLIRFAKKSGMGIRLTQAHSDYQQYIAGLGTGIKAPGS